MLKETGMISQPSWRRPEGDTSTDAVRTGWFASRDDRVAPRPGMWQPCLAIAPDNIPCFDVWFDTQSECERFIREEIIPVAGSPL